MRDFRKYQVWDDAISLVTDIYSLLRDFPTYERYALSDQIRRSSVSIASNIAEGASRESKKDFSHFLQISVGSAFELETQLIIASNLNYISQDQLTNILDKLVYIEKRLSRLISILRNDSPKN